LYFGFSIRSKSSIQTDRSRSLVAESISAENLIKEAKIGLSEAQLLQIEQLEQRLKLDTANDVSILKDLAGKWYAFGIPSVSGIIAEKIASIEQTAESWSICGTTYVLCISVSQDHEKRRQYCATKSRMAFENAISLEPDNINHRINLALSYTEAPTEDNPMKGILMLRELNEAYPENVGVLYNLGRLAIQTGQYDRAIERLEQALVYDKDNRQIYCLLAEAYKQTGDLNRANEADLICQRN
jgi:tetratricopeptide (TPR) repeat protein